MDIVISDDVVVLLLRLGFPARRKGFLQLARVVCLVVYDRKEGVPGGCTMDLYRRVEEASGVPEGTVERNIRSLIEDWWDKGGREAFRRITSLDYERKPSNSLLIQDLAAYLLQKKR